MITSADITHLASLSRIELLEEEAVDLAKEVDLILTYVGQIRQATEKIGDDFPLNAMQDVSVLHNVMREDTVEYAPGKYTESILSNTPFREGNYLKVKKIL